MKIHGIFFLQIDPLSGYDNGKATPITTSNQTTVLSLSISVRRMGVVLIVIPAAA